MHDGFDTIYSYNRADVPKTKLILVEVGRWSGVVGAFIFFAFLALTPEAVREYRRWLGIVLRCFTASFWKERRSGGRQSK